MLVSADSRLTRQGGHINQNIQNIDHEDLIFIMKGVGRQPGLKYVVTYLTLSIQLLYLFNMHV